MLGVIYRSYGAAMWVQHVMENAFLDSTSSDNKIHDIVQKILGTAVSLVTLTDRQSYPGKPKLSTHIFILLYT